MHPFVCILTCFANVYRHIVLVPEVYIILHSTLVNVKPVLMEFIYYIIIQYLFKNAKIPGPYSSVKVQRMLLVNRAD